VKKQLAVLTGLLAEAQSPRPDPIVSPRGTALEDLRSLVQRLQDAVAEYESLRTGHVSFLMLDSVLHDLPTVLARARIARGWTHRDLAKALGVSEQQIQKDERGGYEKAALARLRRVAEVLELRITGRAWLRGREQAADPAATALAARWPLPARLKHRAGAAQPPSSPWPRGVAASLEASDHAGAHSASEAVRGAACDPSLVYGLRVSVSPW